MTAAGSALRVDRAEVSLGLPIEIVAAAFNPEDPCVRVGGVDISDQRAFEAFVAASRVSLIRTAGLLTGDQGHAEDIVQEALERTARRWGRLSGNPEAYARRCVVNLTTDRWRRRRVRVAEVRLDLAGSTGPAAVDAGGRLAEREALLDLLAGLPPRQRAVLVLRYYLDLDDQACADALGVSVGTVKSSASRALARLRDRRTDISPNRTSTQRAGRTT